MKGIGPTWKFSIIGLSCYRIISLVSYVGDVVTPHGEYEAEATSYLWQKSGKISLLLFT